MKMKVSEPAVAYNTPYLQSLKNRIIASLDTTTDERKLQECLALLHADEMPGIYSDEEFAEELRLSESGGNATKAEVNAFFAQWGIVRNQWFLKKCFPVRLFVCVDKYFIRYVILHSSIY